MVSVYLDKSKHREGTVKIQYTGLKKKKKWYTCLGHLPWMGLVRTTSDSGWNQWWVNMKV